MIRRLAGGARVLKQHRGHSGIGVWRIEAADREDRRFRMRHAQRGAAEETVDLAVCSRAWHRTSPPAAT